MAYALLSWKCGDCGHAVRYDMSRALWIEPDSTQKHACPERLFGLESGVHNSGGRDAQTSGHPAITKEP